MKYTQRLDNARLAEVLHERGMADLEPLRELLHQSRDTAQPFAEALVTSKLVSDWELSRTVCEIFNLPFLPVDVLDVDPDLAKGMDHGFLFENGLVPLGRYGHTLTVILPGMVQADVLGLLSTETDLVILPVVGTVETNRRWLKEHVGPLRAAAEKGSWGAMFDEADAAVQLEIEQPEPGELDLGDDHADDLDLTGADLDLDEADLEAASSIEFEDMDMELDPDQVELEEPLSLVGEDDDSDESSDSQVESQASGGLDLPPMPEFG